MVNNCILGKCEVWLSDLFAGQSKQLYGGKKDKYFENIKNIKLILKF